MEDLVTRKRRSGLLCSKKEIILSRSLGAENSSGRKNSIAGVIGVENKNQISSNDKKTKYVPVQLPTPAVPVTFFPYTELDRQRDEDILNRFDQAIGFDDFKAMELSHQDIMAKKRKLPKGTPAKENQTTTGASDQEIIDLTTTTTDNINTRLKSKETSSDLQVSKSTRTSPARRRIKNTIPSDNFERYLASIVKRYPPMNERDRVLFWKFTPDPNDYENGSVDNSIELLLPQNTLARKILENNNENPCSHFDVYRNNTNNRNSVNESYLLTLNSISSEVRSSELINSADSKRTGIRDNSTPIKSYSRREPLRVYGNARQIKQKSSNKDSLESGFKIPSNPDNSNNILIAMPNKLDMSTAQKEEFYKYLGLETASPNGKSDHVNETPNKKRRSLRVRQLQIQQETNRRAKQMENVNPLQVESDDRKENVKKQRLSSEVEKSSPKNPVEIEIPNDDIGQHLQQSSEQEGSPSGQRRTCGSLIRSLSSGRPDSRSTTFLHIIERIDYSKSFHGSDSIINSPELFPQTYTETMLNNNSIIKTNEQTTEPTFKYETRMSRRNGIKASRKVCPVTCKEQMREDVHSLPAETKESKDLEKTENEQNKQISDIIEVGRKCQEKHLQEKVPTVVSCVEHIAYEKPVRLREIEEKFSKVEATSSLLGEDIDKISIQSNAPNTPKSRLADDGESVELESVQSDFLGFETSSCENVYHSVSNEQNMLDNKESQEQIPDEKSAHPSEHESVINTLVSRSPPSSDKEASGNTHILPETYLLVKTNEEASLENILEPNSNGKVSSNNQVPSVVCKKKRRLSKRKRSTNNIVKNNKLFLSNSEIVEDAAKVQCLELRNSSPQLEHQRDKIDVSHVDTPKLNSTHKNHPKPTKGRWIKKMKRSNMLKIIRKCVYKTKLEKRNNKVIPQNVISTIEDLSKLELSEKPSADSQVLSIAVPIHSEEVAPIISEEIVTSSRNGINNESSEDMFQGIESPPEKICVPNALPNPLEKCAGAVLHGFYEVEMLIIVQERKVSFWKYFKALRMLGQPQDWLLLGEHDRLLNDMEVISPCKNRLCLNEGNPVYVEMRAKQCPDDPFRTCNMASVYVNIYYYNEFKAAVVLHSVSLDTIRGVYTDIIYTTITNSRELIMCCKQENITNTIRTGVYKYKLTSDLNTLASIYEFNTMDYVISHLECLGEDKLIGIGGTRVSIWDHTNGDLLSEFDFSPPVGDNLGSIFCSAAFQNYLFLYHKDINEITKCPQLVVMAVNLAEYPLDFKIIQKHDLPDEFVNIKSSISTDDLVVVKSNKLSEFLLLVQQPHRLFHSNDCSAANTERFYSAGSQYFVEISEESLIVKTIHEFLLDFVK